jgi:sporulation protein YqfD
MFSLKLVRWLLGYVRFSLKGGNPERFYNYCARGGFALWDIMGRRQGGACVGARSYKRLRRYAKRAGCRLRVSERHGLPFAVLHARKHRGIAVGCIAFFLMLRVLSLRVWCVNISGNSKIAVSDISNALTLAGLYPGALKKDITAETVEQKTMLKLPDIGWMSVNMRGCIADVSVEEKDESPKIIDKSMPCNIKASASGQVISTQVGAGTLLVKKGDAVVKGQLLVSSVVEDVFGGNTLKHASAEIIAETSRTFTKEINMKRGVREPAGDFTVMRNLDFFGVSFPLTFKTKPKGDCDVAACRKELRVFGNLLPVSVYEEKWSRMSVKNVTLTEKQAREEAEKALDEAESGELKGVKVTQARQSYRLSGDKFIYTAKLTCEENIAEESGIFVEG